MKRYIKSSNYVSDMTQRYPEGQYDLDRYEEDPYPEPDKWLSVSSIAEDIQYDVDNNDAWFNVIRLVEDNYGLVAEVNRLEDLRPYANEPVYKWTWHDADITLYLPESMIHNLERRGLK